MQGLEIDRRTAATVQRAVAARKKELAADGTLLFISRVGDLAAQLRVVRQYGSAKILTDQGTGQKLRADARLISVVQQQAVPTVAVGAEPPNELFHPAVL